MERFQTDEFRRRLAGGEVLSADESQRLIDALDVARLAATTPREYLFRVARSLDDPNRWTAEHPSLRMAISATNPADALMLAGAELGRTLGEPEPEPGHRATRIARPVADAVARSTTDRAVADAITWALGELDARIDEVHELRHHRSLLERSGGGDRQARSELRAAAINRLTAAGVAVAGDGYGIDGFADAERLGLDLPCLALAYDTTANERNGDVALPRFTPDRTWFALSHRVEPRPMSRYETAIVTPLSINDAAELALRRLAPRVSAGNTIGALSAFRELMAIELPDVDVDHSTGPLSPAWVQLPLDALDPMTRGAPDERLDIGELVEADESATWPFLPHPHLVWIAQDDNHGW